MEQKIKTGKKIAKTAVWVVVVFHLILIASTILALNFTWLEFFRKLHGG
ncbi:MAG: hypothetical protein HY867_06880 [Chloroflexi bacterium]|nr:hypothetical protein [Chloroflexota bacterium]